MHVVVVGCGRVGSGLATAVEAAGHTVAIIDRKETAFRRLPAGPVSLSTAPFHFANRALVTSENLASIDRFIPKEIDVTMPVVESSATFDENLHEHINCDLADNVGRASDTS